MQPWAAIIIGVSSGGIYVASSYLVSHILKIDDPLDAAAVHGFCGAWGLIMAACFSWENNYAVAYANPLETDGLSFDDVNGCFMGGNGKLLGAALVLILAITAWVLGHMIPFFFLMRMAGLLRVDEAEERMGLDVSHHGGSAYEANNAGDAAVKGRDAGATDEALLSRCVPIRSVVLYVRVAWCTSCWECCRVTFRQAGVCCMLTRCGPAVQGAVPGAAGQGDARAASGRHRARAPCAHVSVRCASRPCGASNAAQRAVCTAPDTLHRACLVECSPARAAVPFGELYAESIVPGVCRVQAPMFVCYCCYTSLDCRCMWRQRVAAGRNLHVGEHTFFVNVPLT